eukprot:1904070-Amphidinium_carterae.1
MALHIRTTCFGLISRTTNGDQPTPHLDISPLLLSIHRQSTGAFPDTSHLSGSETFLDTSMRSIIQLICSCFEHQVPAERQPGILIVKLPIPGHPRRARLRCSPPSSPSPLPRLFVERQGQCLPHHTQVSQVLPLSIHCSIVRRSSRHALPSPRGFTPHVPLVNV